MLIVRYFVDKIGDYGRNNTRRTGGVCDLDSCNRVATLDNGMVSDYDK